MANLILDQIKSHPAGWIFSASHFSGLAPRNTVDQTLLRLSKTGHIRRLSTGLFCLPHSHPLLGDTPPSLDDIVQAYTQKFGYQIQVPPAKAANLLGLSQQVATKHVYLTDGPNRSLVLNNTPVTLKHVCPRKLLGIGTKAGLILQSLYYFGAQGFDNTLALKIKSQLDHQDKQLLKSWIPLTPGWMQKNIATILD